MTEDNAASENQAGDDAQAVEPAATNGAEVAAEQPNEQQQQPPQQSFISIAKTLVVRGLMIYFITSFFRRSSTPTTTTTPDGTAVAPSRTAALNYFENGTLMDLYAYISENSKVPDFDDSGSLVWLKEDLTYGDWTSGPNGDGTYEHSITVPTTHSLRNNGSVYIHLFFVKSGFSPNPEAGEGRYSKKYTSHQSAQLNKYKKKKYQKTTNLITGETERTEEEIRKAELMDAEIVSHWHQNLTLSIVHDFTSWTRGAVPPPVDEFVEFNANGDRYRPIVFLNTYWNLVKDYRPINTTDKSLDLTLTFQPLSLFKWQLYAAQSMRNKWAGAAIMDTLNGDDEEDQDALKEALLETSPYLLVLTIIVSTLHSIFEFLAFKNDIQFWNNRQSLEGLSVRSVFFNVFQSLIVLLYVLDNETNFVIKISCFVGLGIEMWKITKVMDVSLHPTRKLLGFIPTLKLKDKGSYVHSETRKFDELAFRYLSVLLFPLLGGYCVYSLMYQEHKGWYSFVLSMLYGFLLTFGFIMMTPQLFINYKMKSVAHLPWRMLTYKALNTFIDDIFAFVIKMPTMYRLGCLRDDVIFFIFLYQRYIYRVDPTRMNEFGFSQEMLEENAKKKQQQQNGDASPAAIEEEPPAAKSAEEKKKD